MFLKISTKEMLILSSPPSKVTHNQIRLPEQIFTFFNIAPEHYNSKEGFFVEIDPVELSETFKYLDLDQKIVMIFDEDRTTLMQQYTEVKSGVEVEIEKQAVLKFLQGVSNEKDFPAFTDETVMEFMISSVFLILF